jgi:hypothetical protein
VTLLDLPENLGRGGTSPPRAPNTSFVYLCADEQGRQTLHRVVVRGRCTAEQEERIVRSLSAGRWFLPALLPTPVRGVGGEMLAGCCELVSITPTLAVPPEESDVESLVARMEAAALHGWTPTRAVEPSNAR